MRFLALIIAVWFVVPAPVTASVVQVMGNPNGVGTLTVQSDLQFDVTVDKTYYQLGTMFVGFVVDSDQSAQLRRYTVSEEITNNTGTPWTDFHWDVSWESTGSDSLIDVIEVLPSPPFTSFSAIPVPSVGGGVSNIGSSIDMYNGVLQPGATFTPSFEIQIQGTSGATFTVAQYPTIDNAVPEPTTLAV